MAWYGFFAWVNQRVCIGTKKKRGSGDPGLVQTTSSGSGGSGGRQSSNRSPGRHTGAVLTSSPFESRMHEKMGSPIVTTPMRIVIATVEMALIVLMVVSVVDLLIVGRTGVKEWESSWNVMVPIHWYARTTPPRNEFLRGNTSTNVLMYRTTQKKGEDDPPPLIRS